MLRELSHGWLEELTMQTLRTRLIEKLRAADVHDRFRVFYPYIAGLKDGTCIDVHSKMIVVDDEIVRIGSANLANRSMGLDTECDLTIEARGREDVRDAIRGLRAQLLAEHLGFEAAAGAALTDRVRRLAAGAIDALRREDRTLKPLAADLPQVSEAVLSVISVADPEKPVALADLARAVQLRTTETARRAARQRAGVGQDRGRSRSCCLALTALWKFTPLATVPRRQSRSPAGRGASATQWWAPLADDARLHAGGAHDVSAAADHAVRGDRVRSVARLRRTRCSASSCPRG